MDTTACNKAMVPKKKDELMYEVRQKGLRYLMFIKEKSDRTVKARVCADVRPK